MDVHLKICGMKHNVSEVADLEPDYLGFIFYDRSPRNFTGAIPNMPDSIKKVGVFVNAEIDHLLQLATTYDLDVIQLHGDETVEYCEQVRQGFSAEGLSNIDLWKVFSAGDEFDFDTLMPYEPYADAFLFDTKGQTRGGTGIQFNWDVLNGYNSKKPLVLSGGIGLPDVEQIRQILDSGLPIKVIDVNSRFEIEPGRKDIMKLKDFIHELSCE